MSRMYLSAAFKWRPQVFALAALLAVIGYAYWPGLGGAFVFDDYPNIVDNVALHVTRPVWHDWIAAIMSSTASDLQRPLAMLTFAVNHYFTGLDPRPMKLTNIAIHAINTIVVFGLMRSILLTALPNRAVSSSRLAEWAALFIAACWALHPINFLAVLFVVQRMESLCHTFVLIGLWSYLSGRRRQLTGTGGWGLILFGLIPCTALGMLAKESAALLPLYAFCLEICLLRFLDGDGRRDRRLYALFALVLVLPALSGVAWLLPKAMSANAFATRDFDLGERLLTEPRVVLTYLRWIVLPDYGQLSLYHDDFVVSRGLWKPPTTLWALLALPGLLAAAWLCRSRRPLISLGLLWFLGAQLLTATFIPLELVYEHRNYFAALGICLILADLLLIAPKPGQARRIGAWTAVAFTVFCAGVTHARALEWSNQALFSISEASKRPQSPRATYDYARTMVILTNYRADSPFTARTVAALEQARRVPNSGILPDQATLMFAARTGRPLRADWWRDMEGKLSRRPIGPQETASLGALTKCAVNRHCDFPREDMRRMFEAALARGDHPEVLNMYGDYTLNVMADRGLALRMWQRASALRPGETQYHVNLAMLLIAMGRYDEARAQIATLRRMGRLGQNELAASSLEQRLKSAMGAENSTQVKPRHD
jgi:hypothetical protein